MCAAGTGVCAWACVNMSDNLELKYSLSFKVCCFKNSRGSISTAAKKKKKTYLSYTWLQEQKLNLRSLLEALIPIRPVLQGCVHDEFWLVSFLSVRVSPYVTHAVLVGVLKWTTFASHTNLFVSNKQAQQMWLLSPRMFMFQQLQA